MNRAILSVGQVITVVTAQGKKNQMGASPAGDCSSDSFTLLPCYRRRPLGASYLLHLLSTWTRAALEGTGRGRWISCPRKSLSPKDTTKRRRDGRYAPAPRPQGAFWWHARYRKEMATTVKLVKDAPPDKTQGSLPNP